jgi:hypothetical protein
MFLKLLKLSDNLNSLGLKKEADDLDGIVDKIAITIGYDDPGFAEPKPTDVERYHGSRFDIADELSESVPLGAPKEIAPEIKPVYNLLRKFIYDVSSMMEREREEGVHYPGLSESVVRYVKHMTEKLNYLAEDLDISPNFIVDYLTRFTESQMTDGFLSDTLIPYSKLTDVINIFANIYAALSFYQGPIAVQQLSPENRKRLFGDLV